MRGGLFIASFCVLLATPFAQFVGPFPLYPKVTADTLSDTSLFVVQVPPLSGTPKYRGITKQQLSIAVGGGGCDSNCTGVPAWSAGTAYSQNAPVSWTAYVCFSSVAGTGTNTGHTPAAPPGNVYWGCYDNVGGVVQYILNNFVFAE